MTMQLDPDLTTNPAYRQRLERLEQNRQQLISLGLYETPASTLLPSSKSKRPKPVAAAQDATLLFPRRRSPRLVEGATISSIEGASNPPPLPPPPKYEIASLSSYDCRHASPASDLHLRATTIELQVSLKKIYAMDFHPSRSLLAAGGADGMMEVLRLDATSPLYSWKAHAKWLSGACWASPDVLLSTADDGLVRLWDLSSKREGTKEPRMQQEVRAHAGGIWGCDVNSDCVATCSKDASVCLLVLANEGLSKQRTWADAHAGVVKSVCFQSPHVLCSGGNDSVARTWDARDASNKPTCELESGEGAAINSVMWHPLAREQLLVTSFSARMELFDLRKPGQPVIRLAGHCPGAAAGKVKQIYKVSCVPKARGSRLPQPAFVSGGKNILASGGGSDDLTMFDSLGEHAGRVVSRGHVGYEVAFLKACLIRGQVAVAHGRVVTLYE